MKSAIPLLCGPIYYLTKVVEDEIKMAAIAVFVIIFNNPEITIPKNPILLGSIFKGMKNKFEDESDAEIASQVFRDLAMMDFSNTEFTKDVIEIALTQIGHCLLFEDFRENSVIQANSLLLLRNLSKYLKENVLSQKSNETLLKIIQYLLYIIANHPKDEFDESTTMDEPNLEPLPKYSHFMIGTIRTISDIIINISPFHDTLSKLIQLLRYVFYFSKINMFLEFMERIQSTNNIVLFQLLLNYSNERNY